MGFGWLLSGYFFVNVMSLYSPLSFAMLAGYPMMIMGLYRLAPYHIRFRYTFYLSFLSLPFALYFALYGFSLMGFSGSLPILSGSFYSAVELAYFFFSLFFHACLLYSIEGITKELSLTALRGNALRNLIMMMLYYLIDGFARLPIGWVENVRSYFSLSLILIRIIYIFLNLYLIFKCYRHICPEGDENMPDPVSKKVKKEKKED